MFWNQHLFVLEYVLMGCIIIAQICMLYFLVRKSTGKLFAESKLNSFMQRWICMINLSSKSIICKLLVLGSDGFWLHKEMMINNMEVDVHLSGSSSWRPPLILFYPNFVYVSFPPFLGHFLTSTNYGLTGWYWYCRAHCTGDVKTGALI